MNRRKCLVAGLGAAMSATSRAQMAFDGPAIDWPPLHLLDGQTLTPASWTGQGAVVVFWAIHCPFCKRHNAHVDKLYRASRDLPLRVLGVALDSDVQVVRRYMDTNDYRFPVVVGGVGLRAQLTPLRVIPVTCVIEPLGRLQQVIPGEMFEDDVLALAQAATRIPG